MAGKLLGNRLPYGSGYFLPKVVADVSESVCWGDARLRKALVVDDDTLIASSLTTYLVSRGYDATSFPDAHSCVSSLPCTGPCTNDRPCADAIITDLSMPGMSGLSLIGLLRARKCKVPRMAVMSATRRNDIPRLADAGCAYFEKPFELSDLLSWLSSDSSVRFTPPFAGEEGEA